MTKIFVAELSKDIDEKLTLVYKPKSLQIDSSAKMRYTAALASTQIPTKSEGNTYLRVNRVYFLHAINTSNK